MTKQVCFYAIDLEFEQPSKEILSIGAAYTMPDGDMVYKNFMITPSQPVSPFIQELTGLCDADFDYQKTRQQCFQAFVNYHTELAQKVINSGAKLFHEAITWGPGDIPLLKQQMMDLDVSAPISARFLDLKSLLLMERHCNGLSITSNMSLKTALSQYKIEFAGQQHNSAADAFNTLRLFKLYMHKQVTRNTLLKQLATLT